RTTPFRALNRVHNRVPLTRREQAARLQRRHRNLRQNMVSAHRTPATLNTQQLPNLHPSAALKPHRFTDRHLAGSNSALRHRPRETNLVSLAQVRATLLKRRAHAATSNISPSPNKAS